MKSLTATVIVVSLYTIYACMKVVETNDYRNYGIYSADYDQNNYYDAANQYETPQSSPYYEPKPNNGRNSYGQNYYPYQSTQNHYANNRINPYSGQHVNYNHQQLKPKFMDFSHFKERFKKKYSKLETSVRKIFFLQRQLVAYLSQLRYRKCLSPSYQAVNQMSDYKPEELSMYLQKHEHFGGGHERGIDFGGHHDGLIDAVKYRPSHHPITRHKRAIGDSNERISRKNTDELNKREKTPSRMFSGPSSKLGKGKLLPPDVIHIDYRSSPCYQSIKDQGKCDSGYAFSSIALYELLYCHQTGERRSFSEQHIIDCGLSYGLNGCKGGKVSRVGNFVQRNGLISQEYYPFKGSVKQCRVNEQLDSRNKSRRIVRNQLIHVDLKDLNDALRNGPVILKVRVREEFLQYGGGVDGGENECGPYVSTMLLIGSGREDGIEYWLFRNSYASTWGEQGHYKLNKRASSCFFEEKGFMFSVDRFQV